MNRGRKVPAEEQSDAGPLLALSARIAAETGAATPTVDPNGPGVRARVLMVAESPGPATAGSGSTGVLSPYLNDDATARFMRCAIAEAGLDSSECVYWNAVPQTVPRGKAQRSRSQSRRRLPAESCRRAARATGCDRAWPPRPESLQASRPGVAQHLAPKPARIYGGGAVGRWDELVATFRTAAELSRRATTIRMSS